MKTNSNKTAVREIKQAGSAENAPNIIYDRGGGGPTLFMSVDFVNSLPKKRGWTDINEHKSGSHNFKVLACFNMNLNAQYRLKKPGKLLAIAYEQNYCYYTTFQPVQT